MTKTGINLVILIPTYNEALNISELLNKIYLVILKENNTYTKIYIIDDNSRDGTKDLALKFFEDNKTIINISGSVLSREKKEGLGAAYKYALERVLTDDKSADCIIQMDADLSHNPDYISNFLDEYRRRKTSIFGSRYIDGGGCPNWNFIRFKISYYGNLFAKKLLSNKLSDYTGGYNLFDVELLKMINFSNLDSKGYTFQIQLKFNLLKFSEKIYEIPIIFNDRVKGSSKMPVATIFLSFILVVSLYFKKNKL
jgi:dolichol-phosphate mannosyltransferase